MKNKIITLTLLLLLSIVANTFTIYYGFEITFLTVAITSLFITIGLFHFYGWFELNDNNLFKQPLFIVSILLPFYYFILFGCWVWRDHSLQLTTDGFANFLNISKLPLLLLASSVPLASIVNNIHRTIQTESQIQSAKVKNNADAYYSHLKLFIETISSFPTLVLEYIPTQTDRTRHVAAEVASHAYIESSEKVNTYEVKIVFPHKLYNNLFQSSQNTGAIYSPSPKFTQKIINAWNELDKEIIGIKKGDLKSEIISLISTDLKIINLMKLLKVNTIQRKYSYIYNHNNEYVFNTTYFSEPEIKAVVYWLYNITCDIYDLAGNSQILENKHQRLLKYLQSEERRFSKTTFQQTKEVYAKPPYMKILGGKAAADHLE
ncbi:hypothetical protein ACU60Q_03455 [Klebsiella aerogenes]|uniref:hypothetical protein n=1 Tax=Klebsiella michiganensis TaxID=1134687 RepID=UPI001CCBB80D|nr:hypothetical protein [Klebsiella michiganensis]MBZ7461310.1 hypothetical protein [Klebsiella michiganensis]